ncbi:uncharacterized protein [Palaemon carinicauda]|uniref:uncharacterized protein n=1 Tax=Palaemon carinicauda TaxID=392227 RepID=UPI0035B66F2D
MILRVVPYVVTFLWCTFAVDALVNDTAQAQNSTKPVCEPRDIFVSWKNVRNYLVKHNRQVSIPGTWRGEPLKVLRCRDFLCPCTDSGFYCGPDKEEVLETVMEMYEGKTHVANLTVKFVQDKTCKCSMTKPILDDILTPPYILQSDATLI